MNWSLGALTAEVPLGVVTVTFDGARDPAGEVTVRLVAVTPLIEVPGFDGPEVDGRGAGEAGAGDRDRGAAGRWTTRGADPGDDWNEGGPRRSTRELVEIGARGRPVGEEQVPAPTVEEGGRATERGQEVRRTTGDRVEVACRHGHAVEGGRALGEDLEGGVGARRGPTHGQDDVAGGVEGHLAGAGHIDVDPGRAVSRRRGPSVAGELVDVARGDTHAVEACPTVPGGPSHNPTRGPGPLWRSRRCRNCR